MKAKMAAGNWKMNGLGADLGEIVVLIADMDHPGCEVLICPPATLIRPIHEMALGSVLQVGAQDCRPEFRGVHTGDLSAAMPSDSGATHVILGHSERRANHGETDTIVRAKAVASLD